MPGLAVRRAAPSHRAPRQPRTRRLAPLAALSPATAAVVAKEASAAFTSFDEDDDEGAAFSSLDRSDDQVTTVAALQSRRALVLDSSYRPIRVVGWQRAICMDWADKADVLEYYPDVAIESASDIFPVPAVMRVGKYVYKNKPSVTTALSRANILLRDRHTCQYCSATNCKLTVDHIVPVSKGGAMSWTNCVTACSLCNQKKGSKSLAKVGWKLLKEPREPTPLEMLPYRILPSIRKGDTSEAPPLWSQYIQPWMPKAMA